MNTLTIKNPENNRMVTFQIPKTATISTKTQGYYFIKVPEKTYNNEKGVYVVENNVIGQQALLEIPPQACLDICGVKYALYDEENLIYMGSSHVQWKHYIDTKQPIEVEGKAYQGGIKSILIDYNDKAMEYYHIITYMDNKAYLCNENDKTIKTY